MVLGFLTKSPLPQDIKSYFFSLDRFSLYRPGCPWVHRDLWVLGLKSWATVPSSPALRRASVLPTPSQFPTLSHTPPFSVFRVPFFVSSPLHQPVASTELTVKSLKVLLMAWSVSHGSLDSTWEPTPWPWIAFLTLLEHSEQLLIYIKIWPSDVDIIL